MSSYPPAPRPFWSPATALTAARLGLRDGASAAQRVKGTDALDWLERHVDELRRRVREEEATKETPTP